MVSKKFKEKYKIWVLVPFLESDDPNIQYYYDFTESITEYTQVFEELQVEWQWQPVQIIDFEQIICSIPEKSGNKTPLVINLCDGDEVNGVLGVSAIKLLKEKDIIYTGSDAHFYEITTSKIPMKKAFDAANIDTPMWEILENDDSIQGIFNRMGGSPLIIKPAVSGGSMGISLKNVVSTEAECLVCLQTLREGYHGWNLTEGGVIAEKFIKGREFTTFLIGSCDAPEKIIFYPPVERVFHESLPENERFLSFDRLWETYDTETRMPDEGFLYNYAPVEKSITEKLQTLSITAYKAVGGMGYGRLDIRMDADTQVCYVLEVNAQCGLSADENFTSIGAILRFSNKTFTQLTYEILEDAIRRHIKKV
jgi:D-alanine-D-alanine ligase